MSPRSPKHPLGFAPGKKRGRVSDTAAAPAPGPAAATVAAGDIAARIDRLPLTRVQYRLAAITQIYGGGLIATDAVVARLFPFLWAPKGLSTNDFDFMLAANIGAGILVGEYLGGFLSDRFGRKKILVASALVDAVFLWPLGFTSSFGWLLVWNFLYATGMGFMLATNAVYLHEIAPPGHRHKIAMRTQLLTAVVIAIPAIMAFYWVPSHYRWYLFGMVAVLVVICTPLGIFGLPESPRWLEGKGRHEEADKIVSRWEAESTRLRGPLPAPAAQAHHPAAGGLAAGLSRPRLRCHRLHAHLPGRARLDGPPDLPLGRQRQHHLRADHHRCLLRLLAARRALRAQVHHHDRRSRVR